MRRGPELRRGARLALLLLALAGCQAPRPPGGPGDGARAAVAPGAPARWRGGILLDDAVRQRLRSPSEAVRAHAATASDGLLRLAIAFPLLALALHLSVLRRRVARALALRLLAAGVLALCLTGLVHRAVSRTVGRERPYVQDCGAAEPPPECGQGPGAARLSFYSGHTAAAFTALGLVVLHVRTLGLRATRRGSVLQALAAVAAVGMALLRMVSDRHYASDVLTGAALGLGAVLVAERLFDLGATSRQAHSQPREAGRRLPAPPSAPEGD